jgi:hypothetical protein
MSNQNNHPTLRKGSSGGAVRTLQMLLNAHLTGAPPLKPDGSFGDVTAQAVREFQRLKGLEPDGVVGPMTWAALDGHPQVQVLYRYRPGPQEALADIARPYIGATEGSGNRMGSDPRMREIFEADGHSEAGRTDGYPWCCAFVSMCVQRLIAQNPAYQLLTPPKTASVTNFRTRWAPANNCLVFPPNDPNNRPHKGDVVVFTFSHIGIVDSVGEGMVKTIEGNTNEAGSREGTTCRQKDRVFGVIRCFIRLPVPAHFDLDNQASMATPQT